MNIYVPLWLYKAAPSICMIAGALVMVAGGSLVMGAIGALTFCWGALIALARGFR